MGSFILRKTSAELDKCTRLKYAQLLFYGMLQGPWMYIFAET